MNSRRRVDSAVGFYQEFDLMSESSNTSKTWVTVITVAAPVISAIVVAVIIQQTNLRLGEIERSNKAASIEVEQSKLREQQEARRQQFMENHLPKLLSSDESEQRLGRALFFVNYPNESQDVLKLVMPVGSSNAKAYLETAQKEARAAKDATGNWTVVITGDKTLDLAMKWVNGAQPPGFRCRIGRT